MSTNWRSWKVHYITRLQHQMEKDNIELEKMKENRFREMIFLERINSISDCVGAPRLSRTFYFLDKFWDQVRVSWTKSSLELSMAVYLLLSNPTWPNLTTVDSSKNLLNFDQLWSILCRPKKSLWKLGDTFVLYNKQNLGGLYILKIAFTYLFVTVMVRPNFHGAFGPLIHGLDLALTCSPSFSKRCPAAPVWLKKQCFSKLPKKSPNIWITFIIKFVASKF